MNAVTQNSPNCGSRNSQKWIRFCAASLLGLSLMLVNVGPVAAHPQDGKNVQRAQVAQQDSDHSDADILIIGAIALGTLMAGAVAALALTRNGMRNSH